MTKARLLTLSALAALAATSAPTFAAGVSTMSPAASTSWAQQRLDPYKNFRFRLVLDGQTVAGFQEVSGLGADSDVANYREGGDAGSIQKIHGINKATDITLKRGVVKDDADLQAWLNGIKSPHKRKDLKLEIVDEAGHVSRTYLLHRCRVSKKRGVPDIDGNDVAIEELVLTHEGIELLPP